MSITNVVKLKIKTGNRKLSGRYNASSRKTRHSIMQERRESNNLKLCISYSA